VAHLAGGARPGLAGQGGGAVEIALELSQGGQHGENKAPGRRRGVETKIEDRQLDAETPQFPGGVE
jgi:hypothetical protein